MLAASLPTKFPIAFGASAGGSYIRPIPVASQIGITNGAASLTDGFPPLCFTPRAAGGVPPFGEDFNGLFNQITLWSQWQGAGGTVPYDGTFQTVIGGYPKGAIVASATNFGTFWLSTTDNNVTNPDSSGAGWVKAYAGHYAVTTGTANTYAAVFVPAVAAYEQGVAYLVKINVANTAASTIDLGPGALSIKCRDGTDPRAGDLPLNGFIRLYYNGIVLIADELNGQRVSAGISDASTGVSLNVTTNGFCSASVSSGFISNPSVTIPQAITNNGTAFVVVTEGTGATAGLMGLYLVSFIGSSAAGSIVQRLTGSNDDCTVSVNGSNQVVVSATGTRLLNAALIRLS